MRYEQREAALAFLKNSYPRWRDLDPYLFTSFSRIVIAWGQCERVAAERESIWEMCNLCLDQGMADYKEGFGWGHDWESPHGPSRTRCEAAPLHKLRRRRGEADSE